jgi:hypothetical protein
MGEWASTWTWAAAAAWAPSCAVALRDRFLFLHRPAPCLDHQCLSDNLLENLGASFYSKLLCQGILSACRQGSQLHLAPQFLKVAAQKNHCHRSSSTKEKRRNPFAGQSEPSHCPLPSPHWGSLLVCCWLSLTSQGQWCREILHVAIVLHRVPMC